MNILKIKMAVAKWRKNTIWRNKEAFYRQIPAEKLDQVIAKIEHSSVATDSARGIWDDEL